MNQILYVIGRGGKKAFGDSLIAAYFSVILNDNGINACFTCYNKCSNIVDCKILDQKIIKSTIIKWYNINYLVEKGVKTPIIDQIISNFKKTFSIEKEIKITRNYIPVKYYNIPTIQSFDISMITSSGGFSPYRNWPHFDELKDIFRKNNITYIDLQNPPKWNIEFLNYVKKSKIYLGLDSGASHYSSQVSNGKTIIIQSGHSFPEFWSNYDYEYISNELPCSGCFLNRFHFNSLNKKERCQFKHKCMRDISAKRVFKRIKERLNQS